MRCQKQPAFTASYRVLASDEMQAHHRAIQGRVGIAVLSSGDQIRG